MTPSETKTHRRWIVPVVWSVGALVAVMVLLKVSPTAREVVGESALTIFQIVTAPFILETTLALLGLFIVMAINHYRQLKDGDEWVYLQKQEPPPAADTGVMDPPHRHDAVVWTEKPAHFDEAATELEVVEGYVDLGLADDALQELASLPAGLGQTAHAVDLQIRALAIAGKVQQAAMVLDERAREHPEDAGMLSKAALSVAGWLHENKQAETGINEWLQRSRHLDPQVMDALPAGHALRARSGK
jgi:hypothetical protein